MMSKLNQSIAEIVADVQIDATLIETLVEESKNQISEQNELLNPFINVTTTELLTAEIKISQEKTSGLLAGVPVAIKDNIAVENLPLTCASKMLANFDNPLYTATVAQKLKDAGSINMGKLNMDEFAMGGSNEHSYFGPVRNPYDTSRVSGGSSGGSAVAVAAGMVKATLGTDTGGSVRQPASFTNTVGMKPTYGRISRFGVTAFASSLDQVGVITQTVADNAQVLSAIAGADPYDTTTSTEPVPSYHEHLECSMVGKKIAVAEEFLSADVDTDVRETILAAIEVYKELGATVEMVTLPHLKYCVPAYYIIAPSEASSNLARFDGIHYGYRSPNATNLEEIYLKSRAEGFGDEVKRRLVMGTYFLNHDAYDAYYIQAAKLRTLIHGDFYKIFADFDIILGPTYPTPAFKIGANADPVKEYLADIFTVPANLIGVPAISVPAGFSKENLPIGMQLIGPAFSEQVLYQFAYAFEQKTKYYEKTPTVVNGGAK
jgi:aspartyl/glutamyl-tRNA(Asn/Gln) amidotransferase, A subunit